MAKKYEKAKPGTLKKVLGYIGRYKLYLAVSILCALAYALLSLYIPILTGDAIDMAVGENDVDFEGLKALLVRFALCIVISAPAQWIMALC